MAATTEQKTAAINLLKQRKNEVNALNTALAALAALDPATSTADDIQAAVDAYNTARNSRAEYGGISLPALDASSAFTAIKEDADATP